MRLHAIESVFDKHCSGKTGAAYREGVTSARRDLVNMLEKGLIQPNQIHLMGLMNKCAVVEGTELYERYNGNPQALFRAVDEQQLGIAMEAVAASGDFNTIFTQMIHRQFIPGYETALQDYSNLYTRLPSDMKIQYHGGLDEADEPERVPEGEHYPEGSPTEKYCTIENHKLADSASITKETLLYDKTGGMLLDKIANRSENMQRVIKRIILYRIQDAAFTDNNFNYAVNTSLNINGSTRALYASTHTWDNAATNDNTVTSTGGLITSEIIQSGYSKLANMANIHGRIVNLAPYADTLLCNTDLAFEVEKLRMSIGDKHNSNTDINPIRTMGLIPNAIADPEVTSGTYYYGNFKRMFVLQEVQRMQAVSAGSELSRGIIRKWVMDAIIGFGARDYRWVIYFSS